MFVGAVCQWHTFSTDRSGAETLRELLHSGAIRKHQLGAKDLLTPTSLYPIPGFLSPGNIKRAAQSIQAARKFNIKFFLRLLLPRRDREGHRLHDDHRNSPRQTESAFRQDFQKVLPAQRLFPELPY